jgi:FtsH-binding integral membrane protein
MRYFAVESAFAAAELVLAPAQRADLPVRGIHRWVWLCSSSEVQTHLSKVYATIGAGILITALGVYCDMLFALSGTLTMIATFAFLLWVMLDSDVANWPKVSGSVLAPLHAVDALAHVVVAASSTSARCSCVQRVAIFAGFSFFEGVTIGPFIQVLNVIDPSIVRVALLGTLAIFTCFSAAALLCTWTSCLHHRVGYRR